MFFVTNHYLNENDTIEETDPQECFICYEISCENETNPIKLNSKIFYMKKCECDGFVHNKCLTLWCDYQKKCPICRNYMTKRKMINVVEFDNQRHILFFKFVCKITRQIPLIIFLYFILNLQNIIRPRI